MKAHMFTAVIWLGAAEAVAGELLTEDEIAQAAVHDGLRICRGHRHLLSPGVALRQHRSRNGGYHAGRPQDKSYVGAGQTAEASLLRADWSACEPAKAFVDGVTATLPEMQPRMDATLAAIEKEEARHDAIRAGGARIAQCGHVVATVKAFLQAKWSLSNDVEKNCPAASPNWMRSPMRVLCCPRPKHFCRR